MALVPVILSGGSGTRLWPLSRNSLPKQLLALHGQQTMIQETVLRAQVPGASAPILLCNDSHRFLVAEQMQEVGVKPTAIVLEPVGRNTAPAAAVAALVAHEHDPEAVIALLPSDHVVSDEAAFRAALDVAIRAAEAGYIVTFGMSPTAPETGYGYIQRGAPVEAVPGAFRVNAFKEKPNADVAAEYLADGGYFWNGGMFVFKAKTMIEEIERLAPDILPPVREALNKAAHDLDFVRLDKDSFSTAPNISIDYAIMEKTNKAVLVPCSIGWNDVGAWSSLWEVRAQDEAGNVFQGDVFAHDTRDSLVLSGKTLTALVGVKDLVVIATKDAVLVADKSHSQDVKHIVDQLKAADRVERMEHTTIFRPWGSYEVVDRGENFLVNHIMIKPGGRISLHAHHHRAEHWVVVQGTAKVTCGERVSLLHENASTFIPIGEKHTLENPGREPVRLIEVQSGPYLGCDDIDRLEDYYGKP
ncbi:mannose-1-phosphate guanylyltransferase/mannose-6-phosphate isomerase [Rhizomicrobium palustre]|uniref:mannose-1-phosphate guanylyltransferase n=1 Tax=Rhizomicrobium palustre TaxID=189966 RepID=A0A846MTY0_9PROT|nr:mannose-1-phosphate guanylyltransferase/mannose-6-phosphate isomerase [Rhizomicrobium palustre]NIK86894.1 mannose-1-phosphate guanylyltransferase/mannose-6-phosphate isomerase [Rhizomicrobium palustre]